VKGSVGYLKIGVEVLIEKYTMISKVIRQDISSSGRIETLVKTRAPSESIAKRRAKRRSLLHAGYTPALLRQPGASIEFTEIREDITSRVGDVWLIETRITGAL